MKNLRLLVWCAALVGLLGLASMWCALQCAVFPNGLAYVGLMLYVAAMIALACLFVLRGLELLCGLHPLVELRG
jgi:hypothetical protein